MATHLVTGAGSGIGAALADRLLERGDDLVLLARSTERAHDLRSELPGATVLVADLADAAEVEALAGELPDRLDSMVHAAGVVDLGPVADLSTLAWQEQLAVNVVAPAVLTRLALPALRTARGTVVFVNSGAGLSASAALVGVRGLEARACARSPTPCGPRSRSTACGSPRSTPAGRPPRCSRRVHDQEGRDYDADDWIDPATVAEAILHVLGLGPDATISDLTIRPA